MKKRSITIIVIIFSILIVAGIYYFLKKPFQIIQKVAQNQATHSSCLGDDEIVNYEIEKKGTSIADVVIKVINKSDSRITYSFVINGIFNSYHPIELHKCGVYVMKLFNYIETTRQGTPNFRKELWKYNYNGNGEKVLLFSETDEKGNFKLYFGSDFREDPQEIYTALIGGYPDQPDNHGFVIKITQTLQDAFFLSYSSILKMSPDFEGYLGLEDWTKSGSYFWGDISAGAPRFGFVRIERDSWKVDAFSAPEDVLGGDALNLEKGLITVHPGNVWYGIAEFTEQEKAHRRAQGMGTELYIYNLFTEERKFIIKTDEPLWYFRPRWITDTELEYELPNGEKKIYEIKSK